MLHELIERHKTVHFLLFFTFDDKRNSNQTIMHSFQSLILPSMRKVKPFSIKEADVTHSPTSTSLSRREKSKTVMSKRSTPSNPSSKKTPNSSSKPKDKDNTKISLTKSTSKSHSLKVSKSGAIITGGIKENSKTSSLEMKEIAGNPISEKLEKLSRPKSSTISAITTKANSLKKHHPSFSSHDIDKPLSLEVKSSKTLSNTSQSSSSPKSKITPIQQLSQQLSQLTVNSPKKSEAHKSNNNILESYCDFGNELDEFDDIFTEKDKIKDSSICLKKSESVNSSNSGGFEKNSSSSISNVYLEKDEFDEFENNEDFDDLSISPKRVTSIFPENGKGTFLLALPDVYFVRIFVSIFINSFANSFPF